jgi:hypothetical protein
LTSVPPQLEKKKAHTIRKLHDKDPALACSSTLAATVTPAYILPGTRRSQ